MSGASKGRKRPAAAIGKAEAMPAPIVQATRTMDLIGLTKDGRLVLWSAAKQVRPITTFPAGGYFIQAGHYVINWKNHAVTVHLSNLPSGDVGLMFMCGGGEERVMTRAEVEPLLLGIVVPDPAHEAEICRMLRELTADLTARQDAPHRQRGRI